MKGNNRNAYLALLAVCILWGTTYLALRVGVKSFPPFLFAGIRQLIAGGLLITFFIIKKEAFPPKKELIRHAIAGFLMIAMGNGIISYAEKYVTSGLTALICSLMPVWVILINMGNGNSEKPNLQIYIGIFLGMIGLLLIFKDNISDFYRTEYTFGIIIIFIATFSWALGSVFAKKTPPTANPLMSAGLQMLFGGAVLLACSPFLDTYGLYTIQQDGWYALIYLIIFGSIVAYGCYAYALTKLPLTIVSLYAYVNPIVAIFLGWIILDEALNAMIFIAFITTVSGIFLVNRGFQTLKTQSHGK